MADYVPATIIMVCRNVPLDATYTDTIKFTSVGAQQGFFAGKAKYTFSENTYQRVNSSVAQPRGPLSLRVPTVADNLYDCNYVCFQNSNFGTKWFYAFIKQVNYINPNNTEIIYELDHYQTWLFDFTVLPSFVEREHTLNDSLFSNLQPEPFSCDPDYTQTSPYTSEAIDPCIVVATSTDETGEVVSGQSTPSNIFSGLKYHVFALGNDGAVNSLLTNYAGEGRLDAVVAIFMSPYDPIGAKSYEQIDIGEPSLNGYTPRNQKLFSYPYCCIQADNSCGQVKEYKYEDFATYSVDAQTGAITATPGTYRFDVYYAIGGTPGIYLSPVSEKGYSLVNNPDVMSITDFPVCAWSGNTFANWYAQNSTRMYLQLAKIVAGTVTNPASVGTNLQRGISALELVPEFQNQMASGGRAMSQGTGPMLGYLTKQLSFNLYKMSIKPELAARIDSYFDMFGYATNLVKVPNMEGRESWNYVKTRNVIISGSLPVDAMDAVKAMFNRGVRFWHGDFVGQYNRSNKVVRQ